MDSTAKPYTTADLDELRRGVACSLVADAEHNRRMLATIAELESALAAARAEVDIVAASRDQAARGLKEAQQRHGALRAEIAAARAEAEQENERIIDALDGLVGDFGQGGVAEFAGGDPIKAIKRLRDYKAGEDEATGRREDRLERDAEQARRERNELDSYVGNLRVANDALHANYRQSEELRQAAQRDAAGARAALDALTKKWRTLIAEASEAESDPDYHQGLIDGLTRAVTELEKAHARHRGTAGNEGGNQ